MEITELKDWLREQLGELLGVDARQLDSRQTFHHYGLDSRGAVQLIARLSRGLNRVLSPTLVWEQPTLEALAGWLTGRRPGAAEGAERTGAVAADQEPIALIGMSCRFPGAADIPAFWRLLGEGKDAISDAPKARWSRAELAALDLTSEEQTALLRAGLLERIDTFDPLFFGISPREAIYMDPQQRLFLELCWEALEDAGLAPDTLRGSATAVFAATAWSDYTVLLDRAGASAIGPHTITGSHRSILANRVSYLLDLHGPSITVDSACSSGLVAVHLALESLRRGESTLALAGGINLNILPESTLGVARFGALSADGHCYAFDARANGYVRSEGAGVVALERLSLAIARGHRIHCLIRGSAVNNDGHKNGLTAPNPAAQEAVLREAYRRAGVHPEAVQYVEAHGTGTALGDPIEARALHKVLAQARPEGQPLLIGSAKANVGHLEAGAGLVGLIKTALALRHRQIPPSICFEQANPYIAFAELGLAVPTSLRPWPASTKRLLAGTSSFGFGGTNAHAVLEEWPAPPGPDGPLLAPPEALTVDPAVDAEKGVVFVYPGLGAQWHGMVGPLLQGQPLFRAVIEQCAEVVQRFLGWSLLDELTAVPALSHIHRADVSLVAVIAVDLAFTALWRSFGVVPAATVGYSAGEVAAAAAAGALTLEDAMRVACAYAQALTGCVGQGAMALVELGWEAAGKALVPYAEHVFAAIADSQETTVIGGGKHELAAAMTALHAQGIVCRLVRVEVAPHTPLVAAARPTLAALLRGLRRCDTTIPFISALTGTELPGAALDESYWLRNFAEPVFFSRAIDTLIARGHRVFLDVGPHPTTRAAVQTNLRHAAVPGIALASLIHGEADSTTLLATLAALRGLGCVRVSPRQERAWPLLLSAKTKEGLRATAQRYQAFLATTAASLADLTYTANLRRSHHPHRLAAVGSTKEQVAAALAAHERGEARPEILVGQALQRRAGVVFVFPGQGSRFFGLGRQLLDEQAAFREALVLGDQAIRDQAGFSVMEELLRPESEARLDQIQIVQPLLFALQVALAALWRSWGIEPAGVIGHSMGEVAAAQVAGALTLRDAATIICQRSRLLRRVSGRGAMALVELTLAEAEAVLAANKAPVSIAASNGPRATVLAGDPAALHELVTRLETRGVFCRQLLVDVASHTAQMDDLCGELRTALAGVSPQAARIEMRSTVTLESLHGGELGADYWAANLRQPVRFFQAVEQWIAAGHTCFVEMSLHPTLTAAVDECLRARGAEGLALAPLRRWQDERRTLLMALAALHTRGCPVRWQQLYPEGGRIVDLPTYAWQRNRYWITAPAEGVLGRTGGPGTPAGHPLLGTDITHFLHPAERTFAQTVSAERFGYLRDHRVQTELVFPGAGYVELALGAGVNVYNSHRLQLEEVAFEHMLALVEGTACVMQVALLAPSGGCSQFQVASRAESGQTWTRHALGRVRLSESGPARPRLTETLSAVRARLAQQLSAPEHYARLQQFGITCGPSFQGVTEVWRGQDEALGRVCLPETVAAEGYLLHPAWLDACLQVALTIFLAVELGDTYVPVGIGRVEVRAHPPRQVWVLATRRTEDPSAAAQLVCDLKIVDEAGYSLVEIERLALRRLEVTIPRQADSLVGCQYGVAWRPQPPEPALPPLPSPALGEQGTWLLFADRGPLAAGLQAALGGRGHSCVLVRPGPGYQPLGVDLIQIRPDHKQDYGRLFRAVFGERGTCAGIVHLLSLDATSNDATTATTLAADLAYASLSAVLLVQTIVEQGFAEPPRLFLMTRSAQAVDATAPISLAQTPVLGLGRTLALEHPELRCTRIDLGLPASEASDLQILLGELSNPSREDQIAVRSGVRYVARIVHEQSRREPLPAPLAIRPDRTYLLTGGLGGLGLGLAAWLVEQGARQLVLVGRRSPDESARQLITKLEESGAAVHCVQADVASAQAVAELLATVRASMPPLGGIVHAAGVLHDQTLLVQSAESWQATFAPKALGAWNLHTLAPAENLDFFVLYSSAAALLGAPGQANYAAANAFVDALAEYRRRRGLPALSIQWGPFAEVGLAAAAANRGQRLVERGLPSLLPAEGTGAWRRLLGQPKPVVGVFRLALPQWLAFVPQAAELPYYAELLSESAASSPAAPPAQPFLERLRMTPGPEQLPLLLRYLQEELGAVLQLAPARIDPTTPLPSLGVDSLLSLELRSRLEVGLGIRLSATLLIAHADLAALARYILKRSDLLDAPAAAVDAAGVKLRRRPVADSEVAPLAAGQLRLWFLHRLSPGSTVYNVHFGLRLWGPLRAEVLRAGLGALRRRHTLLRATFQEVDGHPRVVPETPDAWDLAEVDLRDRPAPNRQSLVAALASAQAAVPFDLARGPLVRATLVLLDAQEHELLVTMHHIITDGWSVQVFLSELAELYERLSTGGSADLPALPLRAVDYALWQEELFRSGAWDGELAWWKRRLAGLPRLELPVARTLAHSPGAAGGDHVFRLPKGVVAGLETLARRESCTLFVALLTAWSALLSRYSQQTDFGVGTVVAARDRPLLHSVVGFVANTLVLRCDLSGDPSFLAVLARSRAAVDEALARQEVSFERVVAAVGGARTPTMNPLFRAAFVFQNVPQPSMRVSGMQWSPVLRRLDIGAPGTAKFELGLTMASTDGEIVAMLEYATDLFDSAVIARMAGHFEVLLGAAVKNPACALSHLPLLTPAEHEQLTRWNQTERPYPAERCIHDLIVEQAERTPASVAVHAEDEVLSYGELNLRSQALAVRLRALGVGPGVCVGAFLERSGALVVALLGILRAGGAYVPLESAHPRARLTTMCREAGIAVLVTKRQHLDELPQTAAVVCCLDAPDTATASRPDSAAVAPVPDDLAYVMFTSGSTGAPKGVAMPHRGVVNRLHWMQRQYQLGRADRVLHKTPFGFDVSVWEFFWPLQVGATLVVAPPGIHREPRQLIALIERQQITTIHFVPSMLAAFLEALVSGECASLQRVLCSGEELSRQLADHFFNRLGAELHNLYGPTEAAIDVTADRVLPDYEPITIGRPIDNVSVRIVDPQLQLVPVGVPGELCISGVALARGYINRPELTAERFVADPYGPPGARMYRTGDLVRYQPDGRIQYLGRSDRQVKVRGNRIELDEVEAALAGHPQLRAAAVLLRGEPGREPELTAVIVGTPEARLSAAELRDYLGARLPEYMLPAAFVFLPALPLNAAGKLDRGRLVALASQPCPREPSVAPRTQREQAICAAYQRVLGLTQVGIGEDFFVLGGDSLKLVQLVRELARDEIVVSLREAHENQSPQKLARYLAQRAGDLTPAPVPLALLASPVERRESLPADVEDAYPLTQMQRLMLTAHRQAPAGTGVYHLQLGVELLDPGFCVATLRHALTILVARQPVLRTGLFAAPDGLLQIIRRAVPIELDVQDLCGLSPAEQETAAERWHLADRQRGFRFEDASVALFRLGVFFTGGDRVKLTLSITHLLLDGWSNIEFWNQLLELYAQHQREPRGEPEPPFSANVFKEFVALEQELLAQAEPAQFWRSELATMAPLPAPAPASGEQEFISQEHELKPALAYELRQLAVALELSRQALFLSSFVDLTARLRGRDTPVGLVVSGRSERLSDPLHALGLFWNIVPFYCRRSKDKRAQAGHVFRKLLAVQSFSRYPLARIGGADWLPASFCFVRFHNQTNRVSPTLVGRYHHDVLHFPVNLLVAISPLDEKVRLRVVVDRSRCDRRLSESLLADYVSLLSSLVVVD